MMRLEKNMDQFDKNVEAGTDVQMPTADPRIFGPPTWEALHMFAQNYPNKPSTRRRHACVRFMFALSWMLPCSKCGKHFRKFLRANDIKDAARTRNTLIDLLVAAHNSVNVHTHPNTLPFSPECARMQYSYRRCGSCPPPLLWE